MPVGTMFISTTHEIPRHAITRYLGLVAAEACLAPEELKDLPGFIRKVEGGRHAGFERVIAHARHEALASLEQQAREVGANAIVGVDFDYTFLPDVGLLMLAVSGTAVVIEDRRKL